MPDLATHMLVPALRVVTGKPLKNWPIFILGNILPDLFGRTLNYLLYSFSVYVGDFSAPFHSVIVMPLYCFAVALLFADSLRQRAFKLLVGGSLLHLFLDVFQIHVSNGNKIFYPLLSGSFEIPLFWPEMSLYTIPFMLILWGILLWRHKKNSVIATETLER